MRPNSRRQGTLFVAALSLGLSLLLAARPASDWKSLAPGMDLKYVLANTPGSVGGSRILMLRLVPSLWQLEAVGMTQTGESAGVTARSWSRRRTFSAAINAGMFATDYKPLLGCMGSAGHIND